MHCLPDHFPPFHHIHAFLRTWPQGSQNVIDLIIWELSNDRSTLKWCSLVLPIFQALSQRIIFCAVTFSVNIWTGDSVWCKFLHVTEARPTIAAYVCAVKISLRICLSSTMFYTMASQNADSLGVLWLFLNVRTLYLEAGSGVYPHHHWYDRQAAVHEFALFPQFSQCNEYNLGLL